MLDSLNTEVATLKEDFKQKTNEAEVLKTGIEKAQITL